MPTAPRKQRRAQVLADRKREKKERGGASPEDYAWMAGLLPASGGKVLEVGAAQEKSSEALRGRGWKVVPIDTAEVLAEGAFEGDRIDAVTCWLLDLTRAKPEALARLKAMGLKTTDEHRLAVQTLVYRLADRVLKPGGVLQVVDKTREPLGEALAAGMVRLQRAQSRGTSLEFLSLDARPLEVEGPTAPTGAPGQRSPLARREAGAMVSVRSRKL
jgi:hypothetical protein